MILQSLVMYYEAMAQKGIISRFGWASQKVSYALEINDYGDLIGCYPLLIEAERGKKKVLVPKDMTVPAPFVRSSGICANFMCDNAKYILGVDTKKPQRGPLCRIESAKRHLSILKNATSPTATAIKSFFEKSFDNDIRSNPVFADAGDDLWETANIVFMVDGRFAHEDEQIIAAWNLYYGASSNEPEDGKENIKSRCLLTGELVEPQKTHAPIKGVPGAQSMGAAVVSFNAPAFCSYGKDGEQNLNAPIGKYGTFAYTTALNSLIADKKHNKLFGDTLLSYWAEDAEPVYQDVFSALLDPSVVTDSNLNDIMLKIVKGRPLDWNGMSVNPSNHFYLLGISPNAARLSVRFFYPDIFGSMITHLKDHYDRLSIIPDAKKLPQMLPLWRLLNETVNQKAQDKSASPQLAGDMIRAIITGGKYPATMYQQLQMRIHADKEINHERAAMIKAYLLKNMCTKENKEALTMQLNEDTEYQPYVLGRLFAVLERIQDKASGVSTIKDKYFTSAAATPSAVFPLIVDLAGKHLRKMDGGGKVYYDKMLQALLCKVTESYPVHHTLSEQGVFQLGYYHQKQKLFEKKTDPDSENN